MSQVGRGVKIHPRVPNARGIRHVMDMRGGSSHWTWPTAAGQECGPFLTATCSRSECGMVAESTGSELTRHFLASYWNPLSLCLLRV